MNDDFVMMFNIMFSRTHVKLFDELYLNGYWVTMLKRCDEYGREMESYKHASTNYCCVYCGKDAWGIWRASGKQDDTLTDHLLYVVIER